MFPKGNDKVKAFVCGPPGQVEALAGAKDGFKQGEIKGGLIACARADAKGILKELQYGQDEVYKF